MREIFDPIRDNYVFAEPEDLLKDFVEFFSESSIHNNPFTVEMFPSWTPTMYINLGDTYQLTLGSTKHLVNKDADIIVLRDTHVIRHNPPGDHIFTIKFRPGGLEAVLGVPQTKFLNKIIALNEVLPPTLINKIKQEKGLDARIKVVEEYFLFKMRKRNRDHYVHLVRDLVNDYQDNNMQLNVGQLAQRHFISSRSINRYFHTVIGASPKKYFSTLQARAALHHYVSRNNTFDPSRFGYYDSSHFYKEVAQFIGRPLRTQKEGVLKSGNSPA